MQKHKTAIKTKELHAYLNIRINSSINKTLPWQENILLKEFNKTYLINVGSRKLTEKIK